MSKKFKYDIIKLANKLVHTLLANFFNKLRGNIRRYVYFKIYYGEFEF